MNFIDCDDEDDEDDDDKEDAGNQRIVLGPRPYLPP
jgi:hypothetical protein